MHNKPGFVIAIGLRPHQLASEPDDEDHLDRERDQHDHEGQDGGDDDIATEAIVSIVHNLHSAGPSAVRDLRAFTAALEEMCDTFMTHDRAGFEEAACHARDALEQMINK
jgi:hypothetical protein